MPIKAKTAIGTQSELNKFLLLFLLLILIALHTLPLRWKVSVSVTLR